MPFLILDRLDKSFGEQAVLRELSLAVEKGEILALLGPSGSGKTTALRLIAGFETADRGRIVVDGADVTSLPPERRHFGMVFQHYALFPHLTVRENVAFGLASRKEPKAETARRVAAALSLVDLPGYEARRVGEISGGQQQRVALARALAPEPRVLLLAEPLSNLDPALRERTRRELKRAVARVSITTLLVTHEQEEAFHLGDRVAVLHRGVLQQVGTPEDLYQWPATRFVATFVGRASVLAGRFASGGSDGGGGVRLDALPGVPVWSGVTVETLAAGQPADLVVRPESLALVAPGTPGALAGSVVERRYGGASTSYHVALETAGNGAVEVEVLGSADSAAVGDRVAVAPVPSGPEPRIFRRSSGGPAAEPMEGAR